MGRPFLEHLRRGTVLSVRSSVHNLFAISWQISSGVVFDHCRPCRHAERICSDQHRSPGRGLQGQIRGLAFNETGNVIVATRLRYYRGASAAVLPRLQWRRAQVQEGSA